MPPVNNPSGQQPAQAPPPPPPPPGGLDPSNPLSQISAWFASVPPVTRFFLAGSLFTSIGVSYGFLNASWVIWDWSATVYYFNLWRFVTPFLPYKLSFNYLMLLTAFYQSSRELEERLFVGRTADYLFFYIFSCLSMLIFATFIPYFSFGFFFTPMVLCVVYAWSQYNREITVSFMFGLRFKALYYPWVLVAFEALVGAGLRVDMLFGILVGHLFYFLDHVYPQANNGKRLISTPTILYKLIPNEEGPQFGGFQQGGNVAVQGAAPGRAGGAAAAGGAQAGGLRYRWGAGSRLGNE